ncbi:hypothetical protein [Streptomyces sp. B21-083]|uniref:hypothetical protein n=1 Tax=Streptomyces sp. B21-083 TaxID=3039410 RepID=UPI002FF12EDC
MNDGRPYDPLVGRLLPWTGAEGNPCYVVGDGTGYVSRRADQIECVQLGMAGDLLGHATELLEERSATSGELRYLANRLTEALRDVKRVADSRGARLMLTGSTPDSDGAL